MLLAVLYVAMTMLTGRLLNALPMDRKVRHPRALSDDCPAGSYRSSSLCLPCQAGFFTSQRNQEHSCQRCFQGCTADKKMEVVKECTNTSDVNCSCQKGYVCTNMNEFIKQCDKCIPVTTPAMSSTSTDLPSTIKTSISPHSSQEESNVWMWIVFGFVFLTSSVLIFMLFLRICRKKEKECFKKFVRQCSLSNMEVDSEAAPPVTQPDEMPHVQETRTSTPTNHNTGCASHQPISSEQAVPQPGNLGPLHIYGPQTVFVSLLNQFGCDRGEIKAHKLQEESLNTSSVPSPRSPPVHLSEEERSRENDFIFFPSQEQGKECHISKEEML